MRASPSHRSRIAVAAIALLVACERKLRRTPDDTLVYVTDQTIAELDPRYTTSNNEQKISRLVAPGLTTIDNPALDPQYLLAEDVKQLDATTWDVIVRADARFPDGTSLGADDVIYTYRSTLDPETKSAYRKAFDERIAAIEKIGDRHVRFHLKRSFSTFVTDLEYGIVSKRAAEANGGRFPGGTVVGAGAYRVVSLGTREVVLERNPHFFGPEPPMKRIVARVIGDASARLVALRGGGADLAQNAVRPDLIDEVAREPRLAVTSGRSALLTYVLLQNEDPILGDVRVRRAIAHAIDRDRLIQVKFGGRAVKATGLLHPDHWAYHGEVARYEFDPARARRLLDEAGYPDPDGDGPRARFSITYKTSADAFRVSTARVIAQQLGDVGIDVEVRAFEFLTFFSDIKKGNFQMATMQTGIIAEPDMIYAYFHSERIPTPKDPNLNNRWRYRNGDVDRLSSAGRYETDRPKRKAIYAELQQILARDLPVVPLWHEDVVAVMNKDVKGFAAFPNATISGLERVSKGR